MASEQKAIFVREVGKPVELGTREIPSPGEGQVLVKVTAAMILPHDTYGRDWGLFIGEKLPFVLASNVAGAVESVGSGVTTANTGDRVFGMSDYAAALPHHAGLQQYAILDAGALAKTPEGFTDEQVVTLPTNLVTSFMALHTGYGFELPPLYTDEAESFDYSSTAIVIVAAGSNAGKFAAQLANIAGIGKIIAIAGSSNKQQLLDMGATHFIDRHASQDDIVAQIHDVTGKQGVNYVYDCYSDTFETAIALLPTEKPSILSTLHPPFGPPGDAVKEQRPLCNTRFVECNNPNLGPLAAGFWEHVPGWLTTGKVLPTTFRTIEGLNKVDEINAALDDYRDVKPGPQVIVKP